MFNRYSSKDEEAKFISQKEALPKINAVFEEESKNESSSDKSKGLQSSSGHSIEDPRDHEFNYGKQ